MIPKNQLKDGAYYYGHCRNASVAQWNADRSIFVYMRTKFYDVFAETIRHPEDDDGFDLFVPERECEPTEHEKIRQHGQQSTTRSCCIMHW